MFRRTKTTESQIAKNEMGTDIRGFGRTPLYTVVVRGGLYGTSVTMHKTK